MSQNKPDKEKSTDLSTNAQPTPVNNPLIAALNTATNAALPNQIDNNLLNLLQQQQILQQHQQQLLQQQQIIGSDDPAVAAAAANLVLKSQKLPLQAQLNEVNLIISLNHLAYLNNFF